ncbi:threonine--tRNA ligase [Rhizocola hellebori]|uniref:Threonine--tRNA ligase n=1 Tax=Rhizocola hellebori TaxID=1392758 RepID=A0A8J3VHN1_9ACTN|nr:threonine--tRNA ligase [Rhizocola hellebori]GIH06447.1 threonine--tRNA ligase [Rhizocola hellebori]
MIDHRQLGRELEIFHSDPLIGAGLPIWLPAGAAARHAVEEYIREQERLEGYQHVYSPPLGKVQMYRRSGHLAKFGDDMFPAMADGNDDPDQALMLRPSLCPHHAIVYAAKGRSYRELPLRIAELGGMFRAERSGVVGGLSRVRSIWLNDAHIFCRLDQAQDEVAGVLRFMGRAHKALGLEPHRFRLSLRGSNALGDPREWDLAEEMLRAALVEAGIEFQEEHGEAAFYGPKIDVQVRDSAGREWSLATVQIDFAQPARFELEYVDSKGERQRPVMVHRSIIGSLERLFAHLIEVHQGAFPAWYAPLQLAVLPVGAAQDVAAREFADRAMREGLRVEIAHEGSLGLRVREAVKRKVPFIAVIGAKEAASGQVALRLRDGSELPPLPADAALERIRAL